MALDCESLVSHLKNPKNERMENVRLSIDIQAMKQYLWETPEGQPLEELEPEDVAVNALRWIDTSCMVVDCLTKKMQPTVMMKLMETGILDLRASDESKLMKMKKQKQRKAKTELKSRVVQTATSDMNCRSKSSRM